MAAIPGDQRQVAAGDPDHRADRVAAPKIASQARACRVSHGASIRPITSIAKPIAKCERTRLTCDGRRIRRGSDLVELVGDPVEGRRDQP